MVTVPRNAYVAVAIIYTCSQTMKLESALKFKGGKLYNRWAFSA